MSAEKHGLAAASYQPQRPDWTIEQNWQHYSAEEHATWKTLFERQSRLLPGRACDAFMQGLQALAMSAEHIPNFEQLSEELMRHTGWQVVAVPGLVPDEVFFDHLAHRRFPAGQFIRRSDQLDYLQEPDIFHDVFGHVPMLMHPVMADFMQAYGQGGLKAQSLGLLDQLARVYWYTVEFGLVQQSDGLRIYGAGIVSSATESVFALESNSPHRIRFDLDRVLRTQYRIDDFQEIYFVLPDLADLLNLARIDFKPHYERVRGAPSYLPGVIVPGDQVLTQGTGQYHHAQGDRP